MKIFNITIIPLASALVLGGAFLVTKDYVEIGAETPDYNYTMSWGTRSFDEAVWLAVDDIVRIEENLPPEVESFLVEMQPSSEDLPTVNLAFDRVWLAKLKVGEISPENFIREHVDFN